MAAMKKGERIVVLRRHDIASAAYDGLLLGDDGKSAGRKARWTKHCWYRLLNILFSDEFATRYSQSGNLASRAALDAKEFSCKSSFWRDVRDAFIQQYEKTHERNLLMFTDDMFAGVDPSVIKHHSAEKLLKMSKEMIKNYFIAEQRFTKSGQNENEFWKFVDKRGAVLYMRKWLKVKPDLINFIKGGFFAEDELHTLDNSTLSRAPASFSEHPQTKQSKTNEHVARMASSVHQYVTDRNEELQRTSKVTELQERSQILTKLGDIRRQLGEINSAIARATGQASPRLEEDRSLLLEERQSWMNKLRARND